MAKSKLVKANARLAGAVSGFTKLSDSFVDQFLTREGESVEEAKERLAREKQKREAAGTVKKEEEK